MRSDFDLSVEKNRQRHTHTHKKKKKKRKHDSEKVENEFFLLFCLAFYIHCGLVDGAAIIGRLPREGPAKRNYQLEL